MIRTTVFLAILLFAFALRFYKFTETFGFFGDQGQDLLAIHSWFETGKIPLEGILTSIGTFHMGPFYYYLIAPFVFIFNGAAISPAILFLVSGVLLVMFVYWMLYKLQGQVAAFTGSLLVTLSPHLVFLSKGAYVPNLQPLFVFVLIFFIFKVVNESKDKNVNFKYIFLAYFLLGVGVQLHYTFVANVVSATLLILFFAPRVLKNYKYYLLAIAGFLLPLIPFILGQFQNDFYDFKGILEYILGSKTRAGTVYFQTIVDRITFPFTIYFPIDKLPYYFNFFVKPFFILCLVVIGYIALSKNKFSFFAKIIITYYLISVCFSLLGRLQFWWWYQDYFSVVVLLFATIIISYVYQQIKLHVAWVVIFGLFIWWQIFYLPDIYQIPRTAQSVQESAQIIIDDLLQNEVNRPVNIYVSNSPSTHEGFEYRYLIEKKGFKTRSAINPNDADYIVYESAVGQEIQPQFRQDNQIKELARIQFEKPGALIKFAKVYKINQLENH